MDSDDLPPGGSANRNDPKVLGLDGRTHGGWPRSHSDSGALFGGFLGAFWGLGQTILEPKWMVNDYRRSNKVSPLMPSF